MVRKARAERDLTNMTNEETNTAAAVAEQGAHSAPEKGSSKKRTSQKKSAPKGAKPATEVAKPRLPRRRRMRKLPRRPRRGPRAKATTPRAESKGAKILEMIGRVKGATLQKSYLTLHTAPRSDDPRYSR